MKPLAVNLRQLETHPVQLVGEAPAEILEIESLDELIEVVGPFRYDVQVQLNGDALLLEGRLELGLHCTCSRCLKPFDRTIRLENWSGMAALEGEESLQSQGDWVDLAPLLRDDVALAFPQHPLCDDSCGGLVSPGKGEASGSDTGSLGGGISSEWSVLDQLKL